MDNTGYNLPTPQMLIKKAKEETVSVSLRAKESTVAIFDKMATDAGVNRGAMMNTWLDFYAQNYASPSSDNSKNIMISYLKSERYWKYTSKLSNEDLIFKLFTLEYVDIVEADNEQEFVNIYNSDDWRGFLYVVLIDTDRENVIEINADDNNHFTSSGNHLSIAKEQWPLVAALLGGYHAKFRKLFSERRSSITNDTYRKIVSACDKNKSNKDLAIAIRDILLDYVEDQYD